MCSGCLLKEVSKRSDKVSIIGDRRDKSKSSQSKPLSKQNSNKVHA